VKYVHKLRIVKRSWWQLIKALKYVAFHLSVVFLTEMLLIGNEDIFFIFIMVDEEWYSINKEAAH
jgi:hypothetical protein